MQSIHIEPAPERRNFLCQFRALYLYRLPLEAIPRQGKDICLPMLLGAEQEHHGFIVGEQLLQLLGLERLWARERGVIGKLLFELCLNASEPLFTFGNLLANCLDQLGVALTFRF
jgi:hypothetical protein